MLLAHVPTQAKIWGVSVAACAVIVGVLCRRRKLPPMSPAGLLEVVQQMGSRGTPPKFLLRMRKAAGSTIFRINLPLWNHFCVVADPDVAKAILTHPRTEKTPLYKSMTPIFEGTESMFTKYTFNDGWDWSRKGCARAFLGFNVSTASNAAGPHLTVLDEILHEHIASSKPFDAAEIMVQLTLDMLAASGFGNFPMNAMRGGKSSEGQKFAEEVEIALVEYVSKVPYQPWRVFTFWDPEVKRAKVAAKYLVELGQRMLDWYHASGQLENDKTSLIAHLIRNPGYKTEKERAAEVAMFLAAGHDTTGYSIAWTLYELSTRPEIQDRLAADVAAHGTDSPYLQCVIKEAMRMRPVASVFPIRKTAVDVPTPQGYVIPAGSEVCMPAYVTFKESWIEEADKFIPERWAEGAAQKKRLEEALHPFAVGKRDCLGRRMAASTMTVVVAHLVSKYHFAMANEPAEDFFLTLKPEGGLLAASHRSGRVEIN